METLLVGRREASLALGISLRTLDKIVLQKELIPCRIGKRILFEKRQLEQFARRGRRTGNTPS
jgi:hypothetical protein